jgi:hypothetical protein
MPPATFDIWDQAQLTAQTVRALKTTKENLPSLGDQIAPYVDVRERRLKLRIVEVDAFGVGQLRAPDGDPKLFRTTQRVREELVELALPDEMERISEDILDKLDSTDPIIKLSAGADVVTRSAVLAERSIRRVERMRWEAFLNGYITLDYDNNTDRRVLFNLPGSHKVTAGTLWSDTVNADIIGQVRAWQKVVSDDVGEYALWLHMNGDTWEYVYNNQKIRALLSTYGRSLLVPTMDEVSKLFREGSRVIIYDGGYRDVGANGTPGTNLSLGDSQLTKWLPNGRVLLTTANYKVNGTQIADTPNGRVRIATGYNQAVWKQGPQAETILHPISKNEMIRHARANITRLLIPEAFFVATVA